MATNAIPAGTVTPSVPMPAQWKDILGNEAFLNDKSFAQFVRELLLIGCEIKDPELAAKLKQARAQRYAQAAAVLVVGFAAVFQATFTTEPLNRSARSGFARVSSVRSIREQQSTIAI